MRRYESVVILDPELSDDDIKNFTERQTRTIKGNGGELIKIEDWGLKKLAYRVKKRDKGRFILLDYVGLPALINEIERQFKIAEEVIKFLSVKIDENVDLEAFKAQAAQEKAASLKPPPSPEMPIPPASGAVAEPVEEAKAQEDATAATAQAPEEKAEEPGDQPVLAEAEGTPSALGEKKEGEE